MCSGWVLAPQEQVGSSGRCRQPGVMALCFSTPLPFPCITPSHLSSRVKPPEGLALVSQPTLQTLEPSRF